MECGKARVTGGRIEAAKAAGLLSPFDAVDGRRGRRVRQFLEPVSSAFQYAYRAFRRDRQAYRRDTQGPRRCCSGFTLIEILITVGLMALVTGVFVPGFVAAFRASPESEARKLSGLFSQARDSAMLGNRLIRLKIDLDKQNINFEQAPGDYLVPKQQDKAPSEREREELEKKEAGTFAQAADLLAKPQDVPRGLKFIEVRSPRYKKPMTEGTALVYFFPSGGTDGATIFLETDDKVHYGITVHPITGQARIEPISPEDKK